MKAHLWMPALVLALSAAAVLADEAKPAATLKPLIDHVVKHPDGAAPHSLDFAALKSDRSQLPIGVFDSGIGGLTVLEAILKLDAFNNSTLQPGADGTPDFAGEKFIYLGDQANMPYGNYPSKGKEDFLRELIVKDAVFLLGKRYHAADGVRFDKPSVKAIVIACNTATAYGIEDIRAALKTWELDVPVIGVVEAGARAVVEQLSKDGKAPTVGVLATVGTCASNAYPKAIARIAGLAGKPAPFVVQRGSVGLAGAIEGNPAFVWNGTGDRPVPYAGPDPKLVLMQMSAVSMGFLGKEHDQKFRDGRTFEDKEKAFTLNTVTDYAFYDTGALVSSAKAQAKAADARPLEIVVLGCTHFPLVETEIDAALRRSRTIVKNGSGGTSSAPFRDVVAERVIFINPAEHTARDLFRELALGRLRHKTDTGAAPGPTAEFFLSVANPAAEGVKLASDGSLDTTYKETREPGHPEREDTKVIRMTPETLPASSSALLTKLPTVWGQLKGSPATVAEQPK